VQSSFQRQVKEIAKAVLPTGVRGDIKDYLKKRERERSAVSVRNIFKKERGQSSGSARDMFELTALPSQSQLAVAFAEAAGTEPSLRYISEAHRSGIMFNVNGRSAPYDDESVGLAEGRVLWHLVRQLRPALVIETGFGRGGSAAFFLSALEPWGGKLISIDGWFRPWAGDVGEVYIKQLGLSAAQHTIIEQSSEIALATIVSQAASPKLRLSFIDGSHHFDGTLIDFVYLDRITEVGGIIGIDDAHSPVVRTVASFVANNLPYRLHYPTLGLVLCQKLAPTVREWSHFRPFQSSSRTDWDVHNDWPDSAMVPNATFGEAV